MGDKMRAVGKTLPGGPRASVAVPAPILDLLSKLKG